MGQVYQCWWRIYREINVSSSFEYHMFYSLYPFVAYLLTLCRMSFVCHMLEKIIGQSCLILIRNQEFALCPFKTIKWAPQQIITVELYLL
jgi:hypothetical protein